MKAFLLASMASMAAAACHHGTSLWTRDEPSFGYTGQTGPLEWHNISPANRQCAVGKLQSPIDVEPKADYITTTSGKELEFRVDNYLHGTEYQNLGTTVEVAANGTIKRDGKEYKLKQFHFHTSSEHRLEAEAYPMEVHFVFQAADESVAVVGIMVEVGSPGHIPSPFLTAVLSKSSEIPDRGDVTTTHPLFAAEVDYHVARSDVYQYEGSLTTPPCTEGVAWNVVKDPMHISASTFKTVKAVLRFNSRYTQSAPGEKNLLVLAAEGLWGHV